MTHAAPAISAGSRPDQSAKASRRCAPRGVPQTCRLDAAEWVRLPWAYHGTRRVGVARARLRRRDARRDGRRRPRDRTLRPDTGRGSTGTPTRGRSKHLLMIRACRAAPICTPTTRVGWRPRNSSRGSPTPSYHLHSSDPAVLRRRARRRPTWPIRPAQRLESLGLLRTDGHSNHDIVPGVRLILDAPGHTPGHRAVAHPDPDEGLLLTGDLLHQPVQIVEREWFSEHDDDPLLGARLPLRPLWRAESHGYQIGVSHFAEPFGSIERGRWVGDPGLAPSRGRSGSREPARLPGRTADIVTFVRRRDVQEGQRCTGS